MEAFADVSMNFIPYSMANSSPRSFDTCQKLNRKIRENKSQQF